MNVFEFAMQMEKDGESFYREIAAQAGDEGIASIMNFLAGEEVKHYNIFKRMSGGQSGDLEKSHLLTDVKNIFQTMRDAGGEKSFDTEKQIPLYRKAQELEKKSENFYLDKAKESTIEAERDLLMQIAEEEKRHYMVLETIIDFVQRPTRWLEDAEWNNMEEY